MLVVQILFHLSGIGGWPHCSTTGPHEEIVWAPDEPTTSHWGFPRALLQASQYRSHALPTLQSGNLRLTPSVQPAMESMSSCERMSLLRWITNSTGCRITAISPSAGQRNSEFGNFAGCLGARQQSMSSLRKCRREHWPCPQAAAGEWHQLNSRKQV